MRTNLFLFSIFFVFASSCSPNEPDTLPFFDSAAFEPEWIPKTSPRYDSIHTIPSFSFLNQDGDTVSDETLAGKITVADFFFTSCPGICPRLTKNMGTVQTTFQDDPSLIILSYSVTPEYDSVPRLREYASFHQVVSGRWHLLTGDREKIYTLARKGYFADEEVGLQKGPNEFLHTENFILVDPKRRIRGVYNGTNPSEIERLIEDIKVLKQETAHENS